MDTSLSWIKAYVPDLDVTAQEYTDAMTLSGTKVEGFTRLDADLENIIIGQIVKIEQHPDADKLVVCQVNIGEAEPIQIMPPETPGNARRRPRSAATDTAGGQSRALPSHWHRRHRGPAGRCCHILPGGIYY